MPITKKDVYIAKGFLDMIVPATEKPICAITRGHHNWIMEVDNHKIYFQDRNCAIYFALHYSSLGYNVAFKKHCASDKPLTSEEIEKYLEGK